MTTVFSPLPANGIAGATLEHTEQFLRVTFERPRRVLSNAVLNGGYTQAQQLVNLKVSGETVVEHPANTLAELCKHQGWQGDALGLMTAASMKSARVKVQELEGEQLAVLVTSGIANARRAGDAAEFRQLRARVTEVGTINTLVFCTANLSSAAMAEAMIVATEAKAAVLQELDIKSPVSHQIATGTGTDALVVASGHSGAPIEYVGKHTLMGETLARLVMAATADSLVYDVPLLDVPRLDIPTLNEQAEQQCG